jgi:hypothetical protein
MWINNFAFVSSIQTNTIEEPGPSTDLIAVHFVIWSYMILSTNHCVILRSGLYPRWSCSLKHSAFSYTVSVFVCKRQRYFKVHIFVEKLQLLITQQASCSRNRCPNPVVCLPISVAVTSRTNCVWSSGGLLRSRRLPSEFWNYSWSSNQQITRTCPICILLRGPLQK